MVPVGGDGQRGARRPYEAVGRHCREAPPARFLTSAVMQGTATCPGLLAARPRGGRGGPVPLGSRGRRAPDGPYVRHDGEGRPPVAGPPPVRTARGGQRVARRRGTRAR